MQLEATGERVIEEFYKTSPNSYLIYLFHLSTYKFALPHVQFAKVLDYGCGSGYGTHMIASSCSEVVGVDIDSDAVVYAALHYKAHNLSYLKISKAECEPLPFSDGEFDTILSFQVIEHIRDVASYLAEIRRVLKPGGVFICATPDRSTRLFSGQKPWNVWHVREYGAHDFKNTLSPYFSSLDILRMGGKSNVLDLELRRTRMLKWFTLPVTLPFVPEFLRKFFLNGIKGIGRIKRRALVSEAWTPTFSAEDLEITGDANPSVNLIAFAIK